MAGASLPFFGAAGGVTGSKHQVMRYDVAGWTPLALTSPMPIGQKFGAFNGS